MRFKATFGNPAQLSKVVAMYAKLADACLVHLTPEFLSLAVAPHSNAGVHAIAEIATRDIFFDYRIESRAENNRISFFVKLDNLNRAFKSCIAHADRTQVKLTKKMHGAPTLTFEILLTNSRVQVLHDVPLRILQNEEELYSYAEPTYEEGIPSLSVLLPQSELRGIRNVLERMKVFTDYVLLIASDTAPGVASEPNSAQLQLRVERDNLVTITSTYTSLDRVQKNQRELIGEDSRAGEIEDVAAKVDIRKLSKVLQSLVSSDVKLHSGICCIIPDRALVLKIFLLSGEADQHSYVVFYFPVQV